MRSALVTCCLVAWLGLAPWGVAAQEVTPDPTRPPAWLEDLDVVPAEPALRLSAIWIGKQRRVAVIDGRAVAEGDSVGGLEVVEIGETHVRLSGGVRGVELRLFRSALPSGGEGP